ncbi:SHOCT domain-containing protein [Natronorarus salvus]|uniref:SHOCT domain-containing protein n=1 Tax=Natronorarus salvus TaxID=3117733 RepID=UPI002F26964F
MTDLREFVAEDLWLLVAIVTFALTALVGMAGLEALAGAVAVVGWFLLTPILLFWGEEVAEMLFGGDTEQRGRRVDPGADEDTALAELKRRYAEGEIDDEEFEHRLERLVELDTFPASVRGAGEEDARELEYER